MNKALVIGGVAVASAGIGFGAGYLIGKKRAEKFADEAIAQVIERYSPQLSEEERLRRVEQNAKRKAEIEAAVDQARAETIVATSGYSQISEETDADVFRRVHGRVPSTHELMLMASGESAEDAIRDPQDGVDAHIREGNIFENYAVEQDPEDAEPAERVESLMDAERPHIIAVVDYMLNETNYSQQSLTYWADDEVLVNVSGHIIHDVDETVGAINLHRFGTESEDPDIVYVRNDAEKTDYEITKDERNYAEVVQKVPQEDGTPKQLRMRGDDE